MKTTYYQPAIEPERSFGDSPFRLQKPEVSISTFERFVRFGVQPVFSPHWFSPIGSECFWTNQAPLAVLKQAKRRLPVVKATGRIITQQEIDDALDD